MSPMKTAEAELMDFADDIAYAVHDVEDFYRTGLIPLDRLTTSKDEVEKFLRRTFEDLNNSGHPPTFELPECRDALAQALGTAPVTDPYSGTREQRAFLRTFTAGLIRRYIHAIKLHASSNPSDRTVYIEPWAEKELFTFKQLTWYYVIKDNSLASQQFGQREIVRHVFETFNRAAQENQSDISPPAYRDKVIPDASEEERIRLVTDLIAGMTENQAISMVQRLSGLRLGTVMDRIFR